MKLALALLAGVLCAHAQIGALIGRDTLLSGSCQITTAGLPGGTVGLAYSQTLTANGCIGLAWYVSVGTLPLGLTLNSSTGVISGTLALPGASNFTVSTGPSSPNQATEPFSLTVVPGPGGTLVNGMAVTQGKATGN